MTHQHSENSKMLWLPVSLKMGLGVTGAVPSIARKGSHQPHWRTWTQPEMRRRKQAPVRSLQGSELRGTYWWPGCCLKRIPDVARDAGGGTRGQGRVQEQPVCLQWADSDWKLFYMERCSLSAHWLCRISSAVGSQWTGEQSGHGLAGRY